MDPHDPDAIAAYHASLRPDDRAICDRLRRVIDAALPEAESRLRHAHPVWFLAGNFIVGYKKLNSCIRLLFWSGQSFTSPGLPPDGTFKAAEASYTRADAADEAALRPWLAESRAIQCDEANHSKKRRLDPLF